MNKTHPRKTALPRKRSTAAASLARPEQRQRIVPNKRRTMVKQFEEQDRDVNRCRYDKTGEWHCKDEPCMFCHGPRD